MTENIKIPFNDVYFYGVSLSSRDTDIRTDIFANILMRYLRTLKPVSSKLYRTAEGIKYEYSYSFIPTKPLSWRVIKNRRIVEEIEQLSDGKYCLNYYDDQGRDVKRVLFSRQHKWQKTNYYNTVNSSEIICSLVPKEKNGETVILQYVTGETYPVTLSCCPKASNDVVLAKTLDRVPAPQAMALTNYGILYFADAETLNIYNQVLSEEEEKYAAEHRPEVFTNEEDIAGGFCFELENFDSTKPIGSMFDLSEAEELSEEGFAAPATEETSIPSESSSDSVFLEESENTNAPSTETAEVYSLDSDIAQAIKMISDATDVHIDEAVVFGEVAEESSDVESLTESGSGTTIPSDTQIEDSVVSEEAELSEDSSESEDNLDSFVILSDIPEPSQQYTVSEEAVSPETSEPQSESLLSETSDSYSADEVDLLTMNDEAIDDYVQSLIDSILLDAKSVAELKDSADNAFTAGGVEACVEDTDSHHNSVQEIVSDNPADAVIQSNGADYFYYGETDSTGKRSGRGKTLMADGKTAYDGEYKDDMRHGAGSFYYKDGSLCYWGNWEENLRNGFGVGVSSETGTVHMGTWQKNKPVGVGVRFDKNGNFMYIDSACHRTNGGIRITGFTDKTFTVEYWDETTLRTVKKEISLDDLK